MMGNANDIETCMILCDAAQVNSGKLYILGGGWDNCKPGMVMMGVAVIVRIPWDLTNRKFKWEMKLVDADGNQVTIGPPGNPVRFEGGFEVGRPPGVPKGINLAVPIAVNIGGIPLQPSSSYSWDFFVDGERLGSTPFFTRES
jgi:hypothetical protein